MDSSPATGEEHSNAIRAARTTYPGRDRYGLGALISYAGLSLLFFGRSVAGRLADFHLGISHDASFLIWALEWWPYAINHHLNPFLCRLVWVPGGFNVTWSGSIPLASIIAWPLSNAYGAVSAYNVLCLACPVIAGWSAFALCRYLCGRYWPALLGGYLFGFSAYLLGHMMIGHLNLILVFPIPLIVLAFVMRFDNEIGRAGLIAAVAAAIVVQFLFTIEIAATMVFFGALAVVLAWFFSTGAIRERIIDLARCAVFGCAAAFVILSPFLYYLLAFGVPHNAINSPTAYSADLLNFIIPTSTMEAGEIFTPLRAIWSNFPGNLGEAGACIGLPLILVAAIFARERWHGLGGKILTSFLVLTCIAALGPRVHVDGWVGFGMPWKIITHVPILKNALPARFMVYAFLCLAIIASLWLSDGKSPRFVRAGLAILIVAASIPNLSAAYWGKPLDVPAFFTTPIYKGYLTRGETVVAVPYGGGGDSMLWQAETRMYFRMAGGYTGMTPRSFQQWPIVKALMTESYIPNPHAQLGAFMAAHQVRTIIVDNRDRSLWNPFLSAIDSQPLNVAGVTIYSVGRDELAPYRGLTAIEMQRRNNDERFAVLLEAAEKYLSNGGRLNSLSPLAVQKAGLLPPRWVTDRGRKSKSGLWLGPFGGNQIGVGVEGTYAALVPLIAKYRADATRVYFPYPHRLGAKPRGDTFMRNLVFTFDREALARAAGLAHANEPAMSNR